VRKSECKQHMLHLISWTSFEFLETKSVESITQFMCRQVLHPPHFLRCLDLMGKSFLPTVIVVEMSSCAMKILLQHKRKMNVISEAIPLLTFAISQIESSIDVKSLELYITHEELFEKLKIDWSNFCLEFIDYLVLAPKIPFAVSVSSVVVSFIVPLINSGTRANIAILWRSILGTGRVLESVVEHSRVINLTQLRRACIASDLPLPLVKAYVTLTTTPPES
jgi:hypothetical protein